MKNKVFLFSFIALTIIGLSFYSCQKGENVANKEIILRTNGIVKFSNGKESSVFYSPTTIEKINKIEQVFNKEDITEIKKNVDLNTNLELLSYEKNSAKVLISNKSENEKDVVYLLDKKNIYAKAIIENLDDGNKLFKLMSINRDKIFYSVVFNSKNEIKDLKINQELLTKKTTGLKTLQMSTSSNSETCMEKTDNFNDCMLCAIHQECGSDWVCTATCMIAPPACLIGFGIGCAFF